MQNPKRLGSPGSSVKDLECPMYSDGRLNAEYVLPLRWDDDDCLAELTRYLHRLTTWVDVTVVDGSAPATVAAHRRAWAELIRSQRLRLVPPSASRAGNGKVAGVVTGVELARHERVVIADDDVRYDREQLARLTEELDRADLVRPQNVLIADRPEDLWQVRWDTARTLLNRALGRDHPGTFALRRSTFRAMGGYRADVLFENLELSRTVAAAGGREVEVRDLFVPRYAPTAERFVEQRVRQAYDDFAQPVRLIGELSVLPASLFALRRRRPATVGLAALGAVALAEYGRRRDGAAGVFAPGSALWAPLWLSERAVCVWIAVGYRLTGGMPYRGGRIRTAAHSIRWLRRSTPALSIDAGEVPVDSIEG
jgi:glycosyl transferase family 21